MLSVLCLFQSDRTGGNRTNVSSIAGAYVICHGMLQNPGMSFYPGLWYVNLRGIPSSLEQGSEVTEWAGFNVYGFLCCALIPHPSEWLLWMDIFWLFTSLHRKPIYPSDSGIQILVLRCLKFRRCSSEPNSFLWAYQIVARKLNF